MDEQRAKDWITVIEALDRTGALKRCAQAIREDQDREIRLAQAEERRERDRAIRQKDVVR